MMKDNDLMNSIKGISNDKSLKLSVQDLERIIDEELEKPDDEMDTYLIEACIDSINEIKLRKEKDIAEAPKKNEKHINNHRVFTKAITIFASVFIVLFLSISAYAAVNQTTIPGAIIEIYQKYIVVHFEKNDDVAQNYELLETELAERLKDNGIYPILLPEALFDKEAQIIKIDYDITSAVSSANIDFVYGDEKGILEIHSYESLEFFVESEYPNAENVTTVEVSGIKVYVFEQNKKSTIIFKDGLTEYSIVSSMGIEQAIEFAKTIK